MGSLGKKGLYMWKGILHGKKGFSMVKRDFNHRKSDFYGKWMNMKCEGKKGKLVNIGIKGDEWEVN